MTTEVYNGYKNAVEAVRTLTAEDHASIDGDTKVGFAGFGMKLGGEPGRFTTVEGINSQIRSCEREYGLVYVFGRVFGGKISMHKFALQKGVDNVPEILS